MASESTATEALLASADAATNAAGVASSPSSSSTSFFVDEPSSQVEMIEAQLLSHSSLEDFRALSTRQTGDIAVVFEAVCGVAGLPRPMKRYALKVTAAFKSSAHSGSDGSQGASSSDLYDSSIPEAVYQQFPNVPPSLVREWFLSNSLPAHPNCVRTARIGSCDLSQFDALQLADAMGSEDLRRAAAADKIKATKGKKPLSVNLVTVLQALPSAIKNTVAKALVDRLAADTKLDEDAADVSPSSSSAVTPSSTTTTALPGLAFAVSDCATASLGAIRNTLPQPLPFQVLFPIALQLSRALAHINNYRVVHRDLHPGNVLVFPALDNTGSGTAMLGGGVEVKALSAGNNDNGSSSNGGGGTSVITNVAGSASPIPRYCLADFGSAVKLERQSMTMPYHHHSQPIGGALAFLPPEVLVAAAKGAAATGWKPADGSSTGGAVRAPLSSMSIPYGKSDVFGLGALLYSLAFGSHPWPGEFFFSCAFFSLLLAPSFFFNPVLAAPFSWPFLLQATPLPSPQPMRMRLPTPWLPRRRLRSRSFFRTRCSLRLLISCHRRHQREAKGPLILFISASCWRGRCGRTLRSA